jgi:hypothetical protein
MEGIEGFDLCEELLTVMALLLHVIWSEDTSPRLVNTHGL